MSHNIFHCVQAVGLLIATLCITAESVHLQDSTDVIDRACSIYCTGEILSTVQLSGIYNDSKIFPDMPMKFDPEVVQTNFDAIANKTDIVQLQAFLDANFDAAGSDLESYVPPDLQANPDFLDYIEDLDYRAWAADLNQRWGSLGKQLSSSVAANPQRHSFVPINYPMIVPGGRFRESYYWDSWWILKGLLVCDMGESALNVLNILLDQVAEFGYIPNGGRIYYLDRSQPPVLSEMVLDMCVYYKWSASQAGELLTAALPLLETEYSWWMDPANNHVISGLVSQQDGSGDFTLNKYHSSGNTPRAESYVEDSEDGDTAAFWTNVRTGAETGWDFSSRWIGGDGHSVRNIAATEIVPVDLNAILLKYEKNMVLLMSYMSGAGLLDASSGTLVNSGAVLNKSASDYAQAAVNRKNAINAVLWSDEVTTWVDYNTSASPGNNISKKASTVASITPLWAGIIDVNAKGSYDARMSIFRAFMASGLVQEGGVLTTLEESGQQWDAPNAWPPMIFFTVQALAKLMLPESFDAARNISKAWLASGYMAYNATGSMYEKYNAYEPGTEGAGGEYLPQEGFGWTNGVVLYLLNHTLSLPFDHTTGNDAEEDTFSDKNVTIFVLCFCFTLIFCVGVREYRRKIVLPEYYVRRNRELSSCKPNDAKAVQAVRSKLLYATLPSDEGYADDTRVHGGTVEDRSLLVPLNDGSDSPPRRPLEKVNRTPTKTPTRSTGGGVAVFARSNTYNAPVGSNIASPMTPAAAARQYRFPRSNTNTPGGDHSLTSQFYRSPQPKFSQSQPDENSDMRGSESSNSIY